jgi:xanthine dehydrogenase/oxidase
MPSALPAVACALAATKTRKPVRFVMDLQSNFETSGKREPYLVEYEVGFDSEGKIEGLEVTTISNCGSLPNVPIAMFMSPFLQNCYKAEGWIIRAGGVTTNTPSNTFCRAPGTPNMIATIEYIMEHVAFTLKKDPVEVRKVNLMQEGDYLVHLAFPGQHAPNDKFAEKNLIPELVQEMETSGELKERKVAIEKFNKVIPD